MFKDKHLNLKLFGQNLFSHAKVNYTHSTGRNGPTLRQFLSKAPLGPPLPPPCPYGPFCTFANKCKYYHETISESVSESLIRQRNKKKLNRQQILEKTNSAPIIPDRQFSLAQSPPNGNSKSNLKVNNITSGHETNNKKKQQAFRTRSEHSTSFTNKTTATTSLDDYCCGEASSDSNPDFSNSFNNINFNKNNNGNGGNHNRSHMKLERKLASSSSVFSNKSEKEEVEEKRSNVFQKVSAIFEDNENLKCQLEASKNEINLIKANLNAEIEQRKLLEQQLNELRIQQNGQINLMQTKSGAKESIIHQNKLLSTSTAEDYLNASSKKIFQLKEEESKILNLITMFLLVHPGASLNFIWTHIQKLNPTIQITHVESILNHFDNQIFKQESSSTAGGEGGGGRKHGPIWFLNGQNKS